MLPSTLGLDLASAMMLILVAIGAVLLLVSIPLAQWLALSRPRTALWVPVNAGAWLVSMRVHPDGGGQQHRARDHPDRAGQPPRLLEQQQDHGDGQEREGGPREVLRAAPVPLGEQLERRA